MQALRSMSIIMHLLVIMITIILIIIMIEPS